MTIPPTFLATHSWTMGSTDSRATATTTQSGDSGKSDTDG